MLTIIDYGMGNVKSVYNAFNLLGEKVEITDQKEKISNSEAIILPGVGSFYDGIKNLERKGLLDFLTNEIIEKKRPYLGICLGLEFLAEKSFENGEHNGFGWIKGTVKKIVPNNPSLKIPHMGWDDTKIIKRDGLFSGFELPDFYFCHSYYFDVDKSEKNVITSIWSTYTCYDTKEKYIRYTVSS